MTRVLPNIFTKKLRNIALASQKAMQEIDAEYFNSKTLKELYSDKRFMSTEPNFTFVKSTKTGEPEKIRIKTEIIKMDDGYEDNEYKFFKSNYIYCGEKTFGIIPKNNNARQKKMYAGMMNTYPIDFVGLGIRQDEIQVKKALEKGISSIPRLSVPEATLYHIKMGFKPVEFLERIWSIRHLKFKIQTILKECPDIAKELITPIVKEKKNLFGNRYYLDVNSTIALANLRTIKKLLLEKKQPLNRVKSLNSRTVEMVLDGKNLDYWKSLLSGKYMK